MLNYGGSITSAFPNTLCSSPNSLACHLCNKTMNEACGAAGMNTNNSNNSYLYFNAMTHGSNRSRFEKCIHCGINICEKCFNENQEHSTFNYLKSVEGIDDKLLHLTKSGGNGTSQTSQSQIHYNTVKKEFKHMYNYSKEIVEKLHVLNNAIKVEESAVSELNSIKHQVTTKAIELIKQINQEKIELIEQIESAKRKYEW